MACADSYLFDSNFNQRICIMGPIAFCAMARNPCGPGYLTKRGAG
jgi:hypothetical protein